MVFVFFKFDDSRIKQNTILGAGNCDGAVNGKNGQPIKVPCSCPPDPESFAKDLNANIDAGKVINNPSLPFSFPTDDSAASLAARIQASIVTLQNLNGPGQGCPASSTTLSVCFHFPRLITLPRANLESLCAGPTRFCSSREHRPPYLTNVNTVSIRTIHDIFESVLEMPG